MANKLIIGINDFSTWCMQNDREDMLQEWDFEKNNVSPDSVMYGTSKKYWWIGKECGHSYLASMNKRTSDGTACPYCCNSHAKLLTGFNDLATTNSDIVESWDYEKNGELLPSMVMKGQHTKVWWKGLCGHSWQATIYHRVNGRGCPVCRNESQTSFPEQAVFYYLCKIFDNVVLENKSILDGKELDIYIPEVSVAVEFDGSHWHQDADKDNKKNELCLEAGITLFRIRDIDTPKLIDLPNVVIIDHENYSDGCLVNCIKSLLKLLECDDFDIDLNRDRSEIYNQYLTKKKDKSLKEKYPELVEEWNYKKNKELLPEMVTASSEKKVWWIGKCGHEWQTVVKARTKSKAGCPYCNSNRLLIGFNDLATTHPNLIKSWNYSKNEISPQDITEYYRGNVWWKCDECGFEYRQTVYRRIQLGVCVGCERIKKRQIEKNEGQIIKSQINYLRKTFNETLDKTDSELLIEWDYDKNIVTPSEITRGSDYKAWWVCKKGHSYDSTISNKIMGRGCPFCSGRKVLKGYNDLETTNPELLYYWDYEKNDILPSQISRNSSKRTWWKCEKGHSRSVATYSYAPGSCPICTGSKQRVMNIDTQEIFDTMEQAAKSCGLKQGDTISLCCRGKQQMSGGYHWKYIN